MNSNTDNAGGIGRAMASFPAYLRGRPVAAYRSRYQMPRRDGHPPTAT